MATASATSGRESKGDGAVSGEAAAAPSALVSPAQPEGERGGPKGPEPTRYGDWEKGGRCFDF